MSTCHPIPSDLGAPASPGALLQELHRLAPAAAPIALDGAAWLGPDGGDGPLQLLSLANAGRRFMLTLTPADVSRLEIAAPDLVRAFEIVLLPSPEPPMLLDMVEASYVNLPPHTQGKRRTGIEAGQKIEARDRAGHSPGAQALDTPLPAPGGLFFRLRLAASMQ